MNTSTATRPVPTDYRKAADMAADVALEAGELHNSIIDGREDQISGGNIRALAVQVGQFTKQGSKHRIDESTKGILFNAIDELFAAENAFWQGGFMQAAESLDAAADALDTVEAHVIGLFSPRRG